MAGADRGWAIVVCLFVALALSPGAVVAEAGIVTDDNDTNSSDGLLDAVNETADVVNETTDVVTETVDGDNETTDAENETTDVVNETTETVSNTTEESGETVNETVDGTTDATDAAVENTTGAVDATTDGATTDVTDAVERTTDGVTDVFDATGETVENTTGALADTVDETSGTLTGTVSTVEQLDATAWTTTSDRDPEEQFAANGTTGAASGTGGDDSTGEDASTGGNDVDDGDDTAVVAPVEDRAGPRSFPPGSESAAAVGLGALAAGMLAGQPGIGTSARAAGRVAATAFERLLRAVAPFRYSRYDGSDPLEHDARAAVYDEIQARPGTYLSEVAESADVPLSTARHHLKVLEREGLVEAAKVRGRKRLFPAYADGKELAAALADPSTADVLAALARLGPASASAVADELDLAVSTVSHHLSRLEEDGLVERERNGQAVINRLPPEVADAFADDGIPAEEEPAAVGAD